LVFIDVGPKVPRVSNIRVDYARGIRQPFSTWRRGTNASASSPTPEAEVGGGKRDAFEESDAKSA
jgi:hypothetical protein